MIQKVQVSILEKYNGLSIKEFLKANHVGRSTVEHIRVSKKIYVNTLNVNYDTELKTGDLLQIDFEYNYEIKPFDYNIEIIYEDNDILIVNKPVGMLVHSDDGNKTNNTLYNAVYNYILKTNQNVFVRPIHRIDTETSGLVIFAKNFLIGAALDEMIEKHLITREYLALVEGTFTKETFKGKISSPIGRDRHNSKKFIINPQGLNAITNYKVVKEYQNYSLVQLLLETGRTHQIRVHMNSIKHTLLGDVLYGANKRLIKRTALHSYHIVLVNPLTNKKIDVKCELPTDMEKLCQ